MLHSVKWGGAAGLAMLLAMLLSGAALLWPLVRPSAAPPRDIALPDLTEDRPRIVVLGTSLSAPPQTWPAALALALDTCRGGTASVVPVAGPGRGSDWGLGQIARVVDAAPDVVLIEFAINDADLRDGLSARHSAENHRRVVAGIAAALPRARIALMTMSPAQGPRGWIRPFLPARYAAQHDLATELGIGLVDLYPRWMAMSRPWKEIAADGLHPDPVVAEAVIVPVLAAYLGGPDCAVGQGRE